jgi:ankyrin repeat domain-containing protein 50
VPGTSSHAGKRARLMAVADINAKGSEVGSALQAASYRGHNAIVQRLLKARADINVAIGA